MRRLSCLLATLCLSTSLVAAEAPVAAATAVATSPVPSPLSQMASVGGALLVVVVLILVLAWGVKRVSGLAGNRAGLLRIQAVLPVGTRERVLLIDAGGKNILVGVTAQSIRTLHVFDEPLKGADAPADSDFAEKLKEWLQRSGSADKSENS